MNKPRLVKQVKNLYQRRVRPNLVGSWCDMAFLKGAINYRIEPIHSVEVYSIVGKTLNPVFAPLVMMSF